MISPPLSERTTQPVVLGKRVPLRHNALGQPLVIAMPTRVEQLEAVQQDMWTALRRFTVAELGAVQPSHAGHARVWRGLTTLRRVTDETQPGSLTERIALTDAASDELWQALKLMTVAELKAVRTTGKYGAVMDALVAIRQLMGGEGSVG